MKAVYGEAGESVFTEAVQFLKKKKALTKQEYDLLEEHSRATAFTVSGYTSLEVLQTFLDTLADVAEAGQTLAQFKDRMDTFLLEHGYEGLNPSKASVIFETNIQTAYNVGHYESMSEPMTKKLRPYWQYMTAGDGAVRDSHAAMEGRVYSADDPIWDVWYPPNGFRCRCNVVSLSRRQVEQRGLKVSEEMPYTVDLSTGEVIPMFPDKGFSNNPAKVEWKPDLKNLSPTLQNLFKDREKEARR